jgi:hypothetical protein
MASTMAQSNVYSLNIVGYVSKTFTGGSPAKFTPVSNPLSTTNNTLNNLINSASVPFGANFYRWNGTGYDTATFLGDQWDNNFALPPGVGGFLLTDTTFTNTFVGEVVLDSTNSYTSGFSFKASVVPQASDLDTLGLGATLGFGDNVLLWNFAGQSFVTYTFLGGGPGGWDPSQPSVGVAESFFINSGTGGNWIRHFTVGP